MVVPSPPPVPLDKAAIRNSMLSGRRAFAKALEPGEREALEEQLADALDEAAADARVIGGYAAFGGEISPARALERAAAKGATIAFPTFDKRNAHFAFHAGAASEEGPWGVDQPPLDSPPVIPDLVLVPVVAIDDRGNRIGHGKGHYDRILGDLRANGALLIGVGWANQRLGLIFSADPWDVPLDGFASPQGFERFEG